MAENAFESGARKNIPAVLVYVECEGKILMLHRNAFDRPADYHAGKWNGLGGKCEADESAREAAIREVREESGVAIESESLQFLGFLQFPNFKAHRQEDWSVCVFRAEITPQAAKVVPAKGLEGSLHWVERAKVERLNVWPADREFLPYVLRGEPFTGCIWYAGEWVLRSEIRAIGRL
jgi:8-oxo-dGTP diphosphatase